MGGWKGWSEAGLERCMGREFESWCSAIDLSFLSCQCHVAFVFPRFLLAVYLLRVLIGSLDCFRPLCLARVITLVLVLRLLIEYCSITEQQQQ